MTTSCIGYAVAPEKSSSATSVHEANRLALSGSSRSVSVEGVVVNDLRDVAGNGFYLQAPKSHYDRIPTDGDSSQAIFVYCSNGCRGEEFEEGDYVSVSGGLDEFASNAQITQPTVEILEDTKFKPSTAMGNCPNLAYDVNIVDVALPLRDFDELEKFTGMLLHFTTDLTITNTFGLQYGQLGLSNGRLINPTMNAEPESSEYFEILEEQSRNRIVLDDVAGGTCPYPQLYFDPANGGVRAGWVLTSELLDATTVVKYFDTTNEWFLTPTMVGREAIPSNYNREANLRVSSLQGIVPLSSVTSKGLRIASLNMLNYFTSFGCSSCRGADNAAEFSIQSKKLYAAIAEMNGAVVGLQEVQNFGGNSVLKFLVDELNEFIGENKFEFIATGEVGGDAIKNAIIYQPSLVTPVGSYKVKVFNNPSDKSRPSVAQSFKLNSPTCDSSSDVFTVVVNHLKSKGSSCSEDNGSSDSLEGEGNCGFTRLKHAQQLMDWLETDPTNSKSSNFLLVGDFNTYKEERAIKEITRSGFVNLAERDVAEESLYSLTFDGLFGTLDYMLASPSLASKCRNTIEWHINSDEPVITDYNDEQYSFPSSCGTKPPSYNDFSFFRASDHDPLLTYCNFECSGSLVLPSRSSDSGIFAIAALFSILLALFVGWFAKKSLEEVEKKEVADDIVKYTL